MRKLSYQFDDLEAYLLAMDKAKRGMIWVEESGHIARVNSNISQRLGYDTTALLRSKIFSIDPSMSLLEWKKLWQQLQEKGLIFQSMTYLTAQQEMFEAETFYSILEYEQKEYCCILSKEKDQSEKDVGFKQLLEDLTVLSQAGIWKLNVKDNTLFYTDTLSQLLRVQTDASPMTIEKILDHLCLLADPLDAVEIRRRWELALQGELAYFPLISLSTTNEKNEIHSIYFTPYMKGNEVDSVIGLIRRQSSNNRFLHFKSEAIQQANEMIYLIDENGKFIYANNSAVEKLGYTTEELLKLRLWKVSPTVATLGWKNFWNELITSEKKTQSFEHYLKTKNEELIPVKVNFTLVVYQGKKFILSMVEDVTERKEREEELKLAYEEIKILKDKIEGERNYLLEEISISNNFGEFVTQNENYKRMLKSIEKVADTDATVLILGETGTGKELIARAIHKFSHRYDQTLVKINCAALPASLIESELFGHEKGAFTGAYKQKSGRFELAHNGTLFLDEIGEMPLDLQSKLLRVLQEGEFERLGGNVSIKVDVRLIAATNRNLKKMVDEGNFREDLYYRLNVFPIYNPPLRDRKDDIPVLVKFFMERYAKKVGKAVKKISNKNIAYLMAYDFPGNVRELENIIERATILSKGEHLDIQAALPDEKNRNILSDEKFLTFEAMQREYIIKVLEKVDWKVSGKNSAAEILGMNGKTLASKMKKLNIIR